MIGKTFEDCKRDKKGTIYADWEEGPFRCLIMRGPSALCAYIGVRAGNPLYEKDCFSDGLYIRCHGGLTYSAHGDGEWRPLGYWWFGADYGHYEDACFYQIDYENYEEHGYTPDEVMAQFPPVIEQFKDLINQVG